MIRMFGDLVIQIFGIVFGGAAVRKNVLHADPVGRRIRSKICSEGFWEGLGPQGRNENTFSVHGSRPPTSVPTSSNNQ